jgi:hypothetical protein
MVKWVNIGCGLYTLVISASLFKWWKGGLIPPDPIHPGGPLPDPWGLLVSPYALAAIGVVLVAVNAYGALQKGAATPA